MKDDDRFIELISQVEDLESLSVVLSRFESSEYHRWNNVDVNLLFFDSFGDLTNSQGTLSFPFWRLEVGGSQYLEHEGIRYLLLPLPELDNAQQGYIAFKSVPEDFAVEFLEQFGIFCTAVSLAISRAGRSRQIERRDRELRDAWNVLKMILPHSPLVRGAVELSGLLIPAREISGDIFDFFLLDESRVGFIVADATGKGPGPCLQAASCRAYLRALLSTDGSSLKSAAIELNRLLFQDLRSEKFVTACFGWVHSTSLEVEYVNAGHGCGFYHSKKKISPLGPSDLPLGVLEDSDFAVHSLRLEPEDYLILFTDGWSERLTDSGEEYGDVRLRDSLDREMESGAQILRRVFQRYSIDCRNTVQADDVTALVLFGLRRDSG